MQNFITALQFLTRIKLLTQVQWSDESFGRSVKYFPLVGIVIGGILTALAFFSHALLPVHVFAGLLIIAEIVLTGGLHCDGFMDTIDGIFSGRSQDKMLEIMKDSRVGANGVCGFFCLLLFKWSIYLDLPFDKLLPVLFIMPIIGRQAMTIGVTCFPYARPDGMGKAFALYAGKRTLLIASLITALAIFPFGMPAFASLGISMLFAILMANYISKLLGGLTGDVYGAITEVVEVVALLVYLLAS